MKISCIQDQGGAKVAEDRLIISRPFFGVADGLSPAIGSEREFSGLTGGEFASASLANAFSAIGGIDYCVEKANRIIAQGSISQGLGLQDPALLPGTCFVAVELCGDKIEVVQAGDCLMVWANTEGYCYALSNPCYEYDLEIKRMRREMTEDSFPSALAAMRRSRFNKKDSFPIMNGQPDSVGLCRRLVLDRRKTNKIILFSDGFVPIEWTAKEAVLARKVSCLYNRGGLPLVLEESRRMHNGNYIPEATAIAVEF